MIRGHNDNIRQIKEIAKLLTEDPDILNEAWDDDDYGMDGPSDEFDERGAQNVENNAIEMLRQKMLSPEEIDQIGFEKEKRGRRDQRAFEHSMSADMTPSMTCQEVQDIIKQEHGDALRGLESDINMEASNHENECQECQNFRDTDVGNVENMDMDFSAHDDSYNDADFDDYDDEQWRSMNDPHESW